MEKTKTSKRTTSKFDGRTGLFARIPTGLKGRFDDACGSLDQADVLTSILEFALPLIERVEPGKVVFKSLESKK